MADVKPSEEQTSGIHEEEDQSLAIHSVTKKDTRSGQSASCGIKMFIIFNQLQSVDDVTP
jgi:hypothetical protein